MITKATDGFEDNVNANNVQAAIAVNHLLADQTLTPERRIELLGDLTAQIHLGINRLWDDIAPITALTDVMTLTYIEDLCFWRPNLDQSNLELTTTIRIAKHVLKQGGFFNNMLGEASWLFDNKRRPVSIGQELTRDLFMALRSVLVIHVVDFDSSQIAGFRADDESFPGHPFLSGELSVWGLRGVVPTFIEEARLSGMLLDLAE